MYYVVPTYYLYILYIHTYIYIYICVCVCSMYAILTSSFCSFRFKIPANIFYVYDGKVKAKFTLKITPRHGNKAHKKGGCLFLFQNGVVVYGILLSSSSYLTANVACLSIYLTVSMSLYTILDFNFIK